MSLETAGINSVAGSCSSAIDISTPGQSGTVAAVICILILVSVPLQRWWRLAPLAVLLVVVVAAGVSCSSGGGSSGTGGTTPPPSGTTTGAYTVMVTAMPSTGSATTSTVTVNVM